MQANTSDGCGPPGPVAVIGPGAVGGVVSARFLQAGRRVLLVGRDEGWRRRFRAQGLRVEGVSFGRRLLRNSRRLETEVRPSGPVCAAVFLCVKSGDTAAAARRARPLAGPRTAVVSFQNGLSHRASLRAAFGGGRTVLGISYVAANRPARLRVRHEGGDAIVLAYHPGNAAAVATARGLLRDAGFGVSVVSSEDRLLWTKAAFNAASNPLGALTGRTNGEMVRIPALKEVLFRALDEAAAAARAAGHLPLYRDMRAHIVRGLLAAPDQPNSMLQDLRAGRRTEAAAIVGPFLRAARASRIPAPTLEALFAFVRRLERELAR